MINIERGSFLRAFFALHAILVWFCALYEPRSMHYLVTRDAGLVGRCLAGTFGMLGLLLLLDVVINDFMPKRFKFASALVYRPRMLMAMAMLLGAEMFVAVKRLGSWGLSLYCLLFITFTIITAFRDVQLRYKGVKNV